MHLQRLLPTLVSIAILVAITLLRDKSRALAALIAVTPINIPLAIWIVSGSLDDDPTRLADFTRTLFFGILPVLVWLLIAFLALRAGWSLGATFGAAYLVWGVILGAAFGLGWLSVG